MPDLQFLQSAVMTYGQLYLVHKVKGGPVKRLLKQQYLSIFKVGTPLQHLQANIINERPTRIQYRANQPSLPFLTMFIIQRQAA